MIAILFQSFDPGILFESLIHPNSLILFLNSIFFRCNKVQYFDRDSLIYPINCVMVVCISVVDEGTFCGRVRAGLHACFSQKQVLHNKMIKIVYRGYEINMLFI